MWNVIITEFSNTTLWWHVSCRHETCQHKVAFEKNLEVVWFKSLLYFVVFCGEFLFHRRFSRFPYTLKTGLEWNITFHALLTHMLLNVLNLNKVLAKWLNKGTFLDCTLRSIHRLWSGVQSLANLWFKYFISCLSYVQVIISPLLHGVWSNQLIHLLFMRFQAIITTPSRLQPPRLIFIGILPSVYSLIESIRIQLHWLGIVLPLMLVPCPLNVGERQHVETCFRLYRHASVKKAIIGSGDGCRLFSTKPYHNQQRFLTIWL